ncbi:hypothetical protein [Paramagnetospirillum caucaseum]
MRECGFGDGVITSVRGVGYAFTPPTSGMSDS